MRIVGHETLPPMALLPRQFHTPHTETHARPPDTAESALRLPSVISSGTAGSPSWPLIRAGTSTPPAWPNGV